MPAPADPDNPAPPGSSPPAPAVSPFISLFDVVNGAVLSYVVFEYIQVIVQVVERFNALKDEPMAAVLQRLDRPLALRFWAVSAIVIYVLTSFGDRKKRDRFVPPCGDSHYLTHVVMAGLFGAATALAARGHFGLTLPFAAAIALSGYSSYLMQCDVEHRDEKHFFARESMVLAGGAFLGVAAWGYYTFTRLVDGITPMYTVLFVLWVGALLVLGQEVPKIPGREDLAARYHLRLALPKNFLAWLRSPFNGVAP